ncbi:MAG: 50S ribosomal protein L18 [Sphingobacteriales bacterium]|nr:MAG: 50S ribosomal protein L18 [Sphingobacteriales bacterium]
MAKTAKSVLRRNKLRARVRKNVNGTAQKPRLCVFRSNKDIYAQIIDDTTGNTICAASSRQQDIVAQTGNKTEKAALVGKTIASKAKELGVETIVFDRGGYLYHGRVKSLAEGAREAGLKF